MDNEAGKMLVFLANNFQLGALVMVKDYIAHWPTEHFFKSIKQNLRMKTQVGNTIIAHLLDSILNKTSGMN